MFKSCNWHVLVVIDQGHMTALEATLYFIYEYLSLNTTMYNLVLLH